MKKIMLAIIVLVLAVIVLIPIGCRISGSYDTYDILIKGGLVYDGSTAKPVVEDVGVKGDKIVAVGKDLTGSARTTINAQGLIVTPGFIDVHNHTDLGILMAFITSGKKGALSMITPAWRDNHNYATQGVTTIVTGLCGGGLWDTKQWLDLLASQKFNCNVYHLIPYGMLRHQLFGDNQPTTLTADQLNTLKNMVEKEMKNGALGVSVGLEYAPDCFTTTDELVEIAKVVKKYGGLYDAHIRDQTGVMHKNGLPGVLNSIKETIEIGKRADIPVHISHIQLNLPWNNVQAKQMYGLIEQARAEGVDITADQHPYAAGYAILSYRLPNKFKTGLGVNEKFKNPEGKAQMRQAIKEVFTFLGPEKISLTSGPEKYRNKTIKEIAEIEGKDPAEVYVDLACLEPAPFALFFEISDQINREIMPHEYVFTASDGFTVFAPADSPHPRFFGCFPRKIKKYAVEEKLLGLNDAIRSMTSLPAKKFKIKGRGMIKVGNYADIAVIDLENLKENATYADRGLYSEGVMYLLVNGTLSIDRGKLTGKRR
ncbi:MAG: amidohydrolase family protein [Syntrophales bacterium]|nr:amidohydrolase family protein [Syntrophales bacterium]